MDHHQRNRTYASHGKKLSHSRMSKSSVDNGTRFPLYQNSGGRPSFLYSSSTSGLRQTYASTSASGSSSSCSTSRGAYVNSATSLFSTSKIDLAGTSDDSVSELDTENGGSPISNLMEIPVWDHAPQPLSNISSCSLRKDSVIDGGKSVSAQDNFDTCMLGWGSRCLSEPVRMHGSGSKSLLLNRGGLHNDVVTNKSSQAFMRKGSSSRAPHANDITSPLNVDRRYKLAFSRDDGKGNYDKPDSSATSQGVSNSSAPATSSNSDRLNKRPPIASQSVKTRPCESVPRNRQVYCIGASTSRLGLGNLVCSSASDVLPSLSTNFACSSPADVLPSSSPSSVVTGNHVRLKKNIRVAGDVESTLGTQIAKGDTVKGRSRTSTYTSRASGHQDPLISRSNQTSRTARSAESNDRFSVRSHVRRPVHIETVNVTPIPPTSFQENPNLSAGPTNRWSSPRILRNQNRVSSSSYSSNPLLDSIPPFGEQASNLRNTRRSVYGNPTAMPARLDSRMANRSRPHSATLNYGQSIMHETQCAQQSFHVPQNLRQPSSSHFPMFSELSVSGNVSSQSSASSRPSYFPLSGGSLPLQNVEQSVPAVESISYGSSTHRDERRPRLTAEGLTEILTALEHIERNEDLSYEQILMLEATILLGGIGLQDRYRDMRADIDNMSYEELLALEERIGSVSTGLSEDTIIKCVKVAHYYPPVTNNGFVHQELETKCSICQEEFEQSVEIGTLQCGHNYHISCIKQWLMQKNQCPICKASAVT